MSANIKIHVDKDDSITGDVLTGFDDGRMIGVLGIGDDNSVFVDAKECKAIIEACENIIQQFGE